MKGRQQTSKTLATLDLSPGNRESMVADADAWMVRAAESAVCLDFDLNAFMRAAHSAFLEASPATREHLEALQLMAHLDDLRRRGVLATA